MRRFATRHTGLALTALVVAVLGFSLTLFTLAAGQSTVQAAAAKAPPDPPPVYPGTLRTPAAPPTADLSPGVVTAELSKESSRAEAGPAFAAQCASTGGPDEFGYTFRDNQEADGPLYNFIDIRESGTPLFLFDDSYTEAIPLGFDFPYYGQIKEEVYVGSNGIIGFAAEEMWSLNRDCLPNEFVPNDIIALYWDDLYPEASGPIAFQSFTRCPYDNQRACWIIQYTDITTYFGEFAGTFQAILFERGDILLQYADGGMLNGSYATIGIEDSAGAVGLSYACAMEEPIAAERAVLFSSQTLRMSKQVNSLMPEPGRPFTYTINLNSSLAEPVTEILIQESLPPDVALAGPVTMQPAHPEASLAQSDADLPRLVDGMTLAAEEMVTVTVPVSLAEGALGPRLNRALLRAAGDPETVAAMTSIYALPDCAQLADNPIQNCGFATGDLTGWITREIDGPLLPMQVAGPGVDVRYGLFVSDPPRGDFALVHGFDGEPNEDGEGIIELAQDVALPADAAVLDFIYRVGYDLSTYAAYLPREFWVVIQPAGGGIYPLAETLIYTAEPGRVLADSGDRPGQADLTEFAGTAVRIVFRWRVPEAYSGPAMFQLDNVTVQRAGPPIFANTPQQLTWEDEPYEHEVVVENFDAAGATQLTARELPAWLTFTDELDGTGILSGTPDVEDVGSHRVVLEAVTDRGLAATQVATITVIEQNDAPIFVRSPFAFAVPEQPYRSTAVAEDEEGATVSVEVIELPAWLEAIVDGNAVTLVGAPTEMEIGAHEVLLGANDETRTSTTRFTILVGPLEYLPIISYAENE